MKMFFLSKWCLFVLLSIKYLCIRGIVFPVSNFGAYPNDNLDDSHGIQLAINEAIHSGVQSTVAFGYGTYNLSSSIWISNATDLTITGQGMDQTLLVGNQGMFIFFAGFCQGLTIRSLAIDFDPLPFTAGYIVNTNDAYLDVRVQSPHTADVDRQVHTMFRYDPIEMRSAFGPKRYEMYQNPPTFANTTLVSPGVVRIPLVAPTQFLVNDPVVAIYSPLYTAVFAHDSFDFTVDSVILYASWYMGLVSTRNTRVIVQNYHVQSRQGRWLSTNADCMHFLDARESISISDSQCQSQGDDGINVHANYLIVTEILNSTTLILQQFNWTDLSNVGTNVHLEFSHHDQPFNGYTTGIVSSVVSSHIFTFATPMNVSIGDFACVADTPSLTITNLTVKNNRGRGVLLETRNIDIRQSIFNQTSGSAVLIQPSLYWHEGPSAQNITLAENLYINCNEGLGANKGIITVLPDPTQLIPVIHHLKIESSTFRFGSYSQGLLQSNNANNIFLSGNYIATNDSTPLISICNSRNITASNNTVFNSQTKIDQYYTYDQTNPCQMNLTSLIDLPPSAFNSSFPPPVFPNMKQ